MTMTTMAYIPPRNLRRQRGFNMLELLLATVVFLIGITGLMALATVAIAKTSSHGEQGTKTVEYAQDKMEQILALNYTTAAVDTTTDLSQSTISSVVATAGTGLTANPTCDFSNPVTTNCYIDYVSGSGVASNSSSGAQYMRMWKIVDDSSSLSKTVTVYVIALYGADRNRLGTLLAPSATLVACKTKN